MKYNHCVSIIIAISYLMLISTISIKKGTGTLRGHLKHHKDIPHIDNITHPSFSKLLPDTNPLWNDQQLSQSERPYFHGLTGPQFELGNIGYDEYKHISSPVKRNNYSKRIVPFDFPERTYSRSNTSPFNYPPLEHTISYDIPETRTTVKEMHFDPRRLPMRQIETSGGELYHNTRSINPDINHGFNEDIHTLSPQTTNDIYSSFLETSNKQNFNESINAVRKEALDLAKDGVKIANKLNNNLFNIRPDNRMILDIQVLNPEDKHIKIHDENENRDLLLGDKNSIGQYEKPFLPSK